MNIVDWILLILLSLFGLRGYFKGLFREIFSLGGLVVGFMVAARYNGAVATLAASYWQVFPLVLKATAFVTLFFLVYFSFNLVGWLLHHSTRVLFLQTLNRFGGIVIGLGKGVAMVALVIFFFASSPWVPAATREKLDGSYLVPPLSRLAEGLIRVGKAKLFPEDHVRAREGRRTGSG